MTKLLEQAIAKARELPEAEQNAAADALLSVVYRDAASYRLTAEQVETVERTMREVRDGKISSDAEMAALWKKFGL
jgi:hypothetical protein